MIYVVYFEASFNDFIVLDNNHVINWQDLWPKFFVKSKARSHHICESIWISKRAPNTMNRDKEAYSLNHIYDPFLTSSASARTLLPCGNHLRGKLDRQFWGSLLSAGIHHHKCKSIYWLWRLKPYLIIFLHTWWIYLRKFNYVVSFLQGVTQSNLLLLKNLGICHNVPWYNSTNGNGILSTIMIHTISFTSQNKNA